MGIAILQKDKRRTGAGMLARSGAVRDDPLVFIELYTRRVEFDIAERDVDRTTDMTHLERRGSAHIDKDSCPIIECSFGVLHGCAQDF